MGTVVSREVDRRASKWAIYWALPLVATIACFSYSSRPAFALPLGRAYEQVSPLYKGGYGAKQIFDVAPDGNNVVYGSFGAFAGASSNLVDNFYYARRTESEWATTALNPPASAAAYWISNDFSGSPITSLWDLYVGPENEGATNDTSTEHQLAVRRADGSLEPVGPVLRPLDGKPFVSENEGVSDDFCHMFIGAIRSLVPEAVGNETQLYEVDRGCSGSQAAIRLVAVDNKGALLSPDCTPSAGNKPENQFNAVSADGSLVYFEVRVPAVANCTSNPQVFVRISHTKTIEVSKSLGETCDEEVELPCSSASGRPAAFFRGASNDGTKIFFMTAAPLSATDNNLSNDLYVATVGCPSGTSDCLASDRTVTSLDQASQSTSSTEAADVRGVAAVSQDGSHVYFVARGVLAEEGPSSFGAQAKPVHGAENLYVYVRNQQFPNGHLSFIGDLCTGPAESGEMLDLRCPQGLDKGTINVNPRNDTELVNRHPLVQAAGPEGSVLVLSTYAQLLNRGPEIDSDNAQDVYRYDASNNELQRVSVGEGNADANGNKNDTSEIGLEGLENADARIQAPIQGFTGDEERKILRQAADDKGARIVFTSAEPLAESASNGMSNVYEWDDGAVTMISSGDAAEADESPVITPTGADIFFVTAEGLVAQDADGAPDLYDARLNGGFPNAPMEREQCSSGDACQGPLTNPAPLLVPGSVVQTPGENVSASTKVKNKRSGPNNAVKKSRRKTRKLSRRHPKKRGHRARHATLVSIAKKERL